MNNVVGDVIPRDYSTRIHSFILYDFTVSNILCSARRHSHRKMYSTIDTLLNKLFVLFYRLYETDACENSISS